MHYASVLATSPRPHWYAKWLNINSVSYSSLVAAASLSTARWFALETLRDLSRGSAFLPGTSPVNEGRNLDAEINAQAAVILVFMATPPPPPPPPPCKITEHRLIQQVTAQWWLPHYSTLYRFANSLWSQPWLRTPPRHSPVNDGRNLDKINAAAQAAVILVCMAIPHPPTPPQPRSDKYTWWHHVEFLTVVISMVQKVRR